MRPPPFRAEHIGSLLRPPALLAARQAAAEGRLSADALRAEEDAHIRDAVRLQEDVGFEVVTDGEYRRGIYFGHFGAAVSGFTEMDAEMSFRGAGGEPLRYRAAVVTGRLVRHRGIATDEFRFVRSLTRRTPKVTLPSPSSQHYLRWRPGVSDRAYPDLDEFFADVAAIYRAELADLAALGATYVQLDDVPLGLLCDPQHRAAFAAKGYDPAADARPLHRAGERRARGPPARAVRRRPRLPGQQPGQVARRGGVRLRGRPRLRPARRRRSSSSSTTRRGPEGSSRFATSRPAARSSSAWYRPRRPPSRTPDDLRRRIDAAARLVPLERLALSPQCGFASTAPGNPLSPAEQRRKLELVVDVARRVWG